MDRVGQSVAHAKGRAKGIAAHAQVTYLAEKLQGVSLFLQRIGDRVRGAVDGNLGDLQLDSLPLRRRLDQRSRRGDTAARGHLFERFFRNDAAINHQLHALEPRAVIQFYKSYAFGIPARAHPTAQSDIGSHRQ